MGGGVLSQLEHFVAYDSESKKVYLKKFINPIVKPSESSPCDICFYDKVNDKLIIVKGDMWNIESFPSSKYTPIGIVVVPGTHNVYGDGSCGVMSLKEMNYNSPDDGATSHQKMYWGGKGTDISTLTNYDQVCYVGSNGNVGESVIGTDNVSFLPSDKFSTVVNPYDTETGYYYNDSNKYIPSPYKNDGSFNTEYSRTSTPSNTLNAMSDFDGVGNTKIITDLATSDSDWKTASSIANISSTGYYPAACCCWRYHTEGTNQGDWYLPACGELGYIMPRFNKIQEAIQKIMDAYGGSVGVILDTSNFYWSSSEYNSDYARYVYTGYGMVNAYVDLYGKSNTNYVRAWLHV